jgi:hypothetical protein
VKRGESSYIIDPRQLKVDGSLAILAKTCGEALEKRYPGWLWTINPDQEGGVIYIYSLRLSGEWGYTIKIADIQNDPQAKEAIMAGGEILERYNIRRGPYKRDLLKGKIKDLRGNFIPDITDRISAKQKRIRDREFTKAVEEGKAEIVHRDTKQQDGSVFREIAVKIGDET